MVMLTTSGEDSGEWEICISSTAHLSFLRLTNSHSRVKFIYGKLSHFLLNWEEQQSRDNARALTQLIGVTLHGGCDVLSALQTNILWPNLFARQLFQRSSLLTEENWRQSTDCTIKAKWLLNQIKCYINPKVTLEKKNNREENGFIQQWNTRWFLHSYLPLLVHQWPSAPNPINQSPSWLKWLPRNRILLAVLVREVNKLWVGIHILLLSLFFNSWETLKDIINCVLYPFV